MLTIDTMTNTLQYRGLGCDISEQYIEAAKAIGEERAYQLKLLPSD